MKSKIKIWVATGVALLTASCTDLNTPVDSQYTQYPNSSVALDAQMTGIYNQLRDCLGRRYMEAMELSSDEMSAVSYSGGWVDGGVYAHPSLHTYSYTDATLDWMTLLGTGCVKANEVINSEASDSIKSMARAMRAYFTFIMMDGWGDAPIIDETYVAKNLPNADVRDRQKRADVAKYIESELLDIIPTLPTATGSSVYGKPSRWMAEALLAKLYINWPVYTAASVDQYDASTATNEKLDDCIKICDDIINSKKFNLGSMAYRFKFAPNNSDLNVEDFIYAMPYDTHTATGMQYGRANSYKDVKSMRPSYYGMNLSNSGGAYMTMTPEFASLFSLKGDERNNCVLRDTVHIYDPETLLPTKEVAKDRAGNPLVLTKDISVVNGDMTTMDVGDNLTGWRQGNRPIKFYVIDSDFKNGRNQSNDVPIFRYADILLEKCEALVRKGTNGDEAKALFNQIRAYVHAPQIDHTPTLQEIYDERGREFFDENWRRNDMIRFGHFEDEYFPHYKSNASASFDKTKRIFPIHQDVLSVNPTWEQNPGY